MNRRRTVADRIEAMEQHRDRMRSEGRPADWCDRIDALIAGLRAYGEETILLTPPEAVYGSADWLGEIERWAVRWQRRRDVPLTAWERTLIDFAIECDDENLDRLARGFPDVVEMVRQWRGSDLAERMRAMPFDFSL